MRSGEGEKLRREIGRRLTTRGRLRRDVRERCERYAVARAAEGASQKIIASELGVSATSVKRWLNGDSKRTAMMPVRVVAPPPPVVLAARAVVATPRGFRIEGLDLDGVCAVIARFG
jgi:hypothetical protein